MLERKGAKITSPVFVRRWIDSINRIRRMGTREKEIQRALAMTEEHRPVAYKAATQLCSGTISEMDQIQLFNDMNPTPDSSKVHEESTHVDDTFPIMAQHQFPRKVFREENDPEVRQGIEQIGGGPGEARDIDGKPITQEDATVIQRKEAECLYPTGKGSLAARAQSAAAANVREGKVEKDTGPCATLP